METELVADVLYGPARTMGGSRLDDDELIKLAREEFKGKPFCVVRNWMILDVMLSESQESRIKRQGLQPTVLYVHHVVFNTEARISDGDTVISGYQKDFHGCFFESNDTLFILAGRGFRKHVSLPALLALEAF
ncbi:DUF6957 family protein [Pseudomonas jessenii]|uniref:DUF6957 family protein n=1 Tax=Pseudomonas jessenii TaxID=77298 RepID=UPI000E0E3740|nr:hypothetical protein [Pseudomonas jessenii]